MIPLIRLRGRPGDCGLQHAAHVAWMFEEAVRGAYLDDISAANRVPRELIRVQAGAWLERLPLWAQEEIDGMSRGVRRRVPDVAEFVYADIATSSGGVNSIEMPGVEREILSGGGVDAGGAMCTAVVTPVERVAWVARNCDWLWATLRRGCSAVVHEVPGRHAVMAVGIHGDIDIDTGVNARGLWLHLHTLPSSDKSRVGRTRFSWLFWAREALETCATLDELEAFIAATDRDRGVLVIAVDGKTNQAALFECGRATYERVRAGEGAHGLRGSIVATNHCQARHPPDEAFAPRDGAPARASRRGSTVRRYQRVCEILRCGEVEHPAHDLAEILADDEVEMRDPVHLRTIYSAVCAPAARELWFAHGDFGSRSPAASSGTWQRVEWPW